MVPNYFISAISHDNFNINKRHNFSMMGFISNRKKYVDKNIKVGDKLIFYIIKEKKFGAIVEVLGESYYDDYTPIWVGAREIWPLRIKTRPLLVPRNNGCLSLDEVRDELSFIITKNIGLYFRNPVRKIEKGDYELIRSKMIRTSYYEIVR